MLTSSSWRARGGLFAAALAFAVSAGAVEPVDDELDRAWAAFVADADFAAVSASYGVLANFAGSEGPGAQQCQQHRDALIQARDVNPFSPALQSMVVRCAAHLGDAGQLRQEMDRRQRLQEFLLADGGGTSSLRPILVSAEADAAVLIEDLGGEPLYGRYAVGSSHGSLPFVAIYYDRKLGRERQLVFDFLRLWQQLQSRDADDQYPAMLRGLIDRYLQQAGNGGSVTAELAKIGADVGNRLLDRNAAVARIEELALAGSAAAAIELLPMCLILDDARRCVSDAVELVRPHAERGLGEAMVVMALAADRGVPGTGGRRASAKWLQKAAERVGAAEAWTAFAQLAISIESETRLKSAPTAALRRAARAGHAPAQLLLAQMLTAKRIRPIRGETADAWIKRASTGGFDAATAQLGVAALRRGDGKSAWPLLQKAAAGNDPSALGVLAIGHESGSLGAGADIATALQMFRTAASFGNPGAMRRLGSAYARAELGLPINMARAEAWYLSASMFGNRRAAMELAEFYLLGTKDLVGGPADGYAVIERLAADGLTNARLRMARAVLLGQGTEANPELALKLLNELSAEGVSAADFRLGQIYEFGQGGVAIDLAKARDRYRAAARKGHLPATDFYARALYAGRGGERDRAGAATWWQKAADKGHAPSIANLAWVRCSSSEAEVRDPLVGTRLVSAALQKQRSANLNDTLAVCLAASGLYREAAETQAQTLALAASEDHLDDAQKRAFADRLTAFKRGEAWVDPN